MMIQRGRREAWVIVSWRMFLSACVFALLGLQAHAQTFSGPYVGAELGRQHIIGGALVDGVDTLQQESRLVVSGFGGMRVQIRGFVLGGELGIGRSDGDLQLFDSLRSLVIDYQNSSQWHWSIMGGKTLGERTLLFAYLSEVSRDFDVSITRFARLTEQLDEQGTLRFGGGLEQQLIGPLHVRGTLGTSRADFGNRSTNIEPERRVEASFGVVFQF